MTLGSEEDPMQGNTKVEMARGRQFTPKPEKCKAAQSSRTAAWASLKQHPPEDTTN